MLLEVSKVHDRPPPTRRFADSKRMVDVTSYVTGGSFFATRELGATPWKPYP